MNNYQKELKKDQQQLLEKQQPIGSNINHKIELLKSNFNLNKNGNNSPNNTIVTNNTTAINNNKNKKSKSAPLQYTKPSSIITTKPKLNEIETTLTDQASVLKTNVNYLLSGSIAGMISRSATAGFERLTIIQQVQGMVSGGPKYVGCVKALRDMVEKEGFLSLFKGNGANIIKVSPNSGIRFLTYEFCKKYFDDTNHSKDLLIGGATAKLTLPQTMISGGMAGLTSTFLTYPLDVVRIRLSLQGFNPQNEYGKIRYKGVSHGFSQIFKDEGLRGLYKGLGTSVLSVAPWVSISFASYEGLKQLVNKTTKNTDNSALNLLSSSSASSINKGDPIKEEEENLQQKGKDMVVDFTCGAISGAFTMSVCYPLDVLRRRMMIQGMGGNKVLYSNGFDALKLIIKNEGVSALYHGIVPAYFKVVPTVAISFAVYELCKNFMEESKQTT
ncbi:mitochondrial substrate carrier family protein [Tieghemostelium lacteum]|uniref:Mitochondrial substrate carrier family protein n=1 Tax=Tieghemostelium lacteum TaxID=361077 RepID=A0A151ZIS8_TIELA|nr:mitochondrial substrate carrier family protein [Tieghemostelium lacteum]|eukprot:KYQ93754.1 mitochondrial substrate carrier family protein [Tieghemostelium lacteum]